MVEFVITSDGSKTLYHPAVGEHYHSRHGAVQESKHVFLGMGLNHFVELHRPAAVSVLEIGFGTGLNFLLTADNCHAHGIGLSYTGVEAFPLPVATLAQTGYGAHVSSVLWTAFLDHYADSFKAPHEIIKSCTLEIAHCPVQEYHTEQRFDVLYFDAFAAVHQPEMWTEETLGPLCTLLNPGGMFVTYAITGHLKRTLKSFGFTIEKVPGAPGKREMLRARKG